MAPTSGTARLCLIAGRRMVYRPRSAFSQTNFATPTLAVRRAFNTSPARLEDKDSKPEEKAGTERDTQASSQAPAGSTTSNKAPAAWDARTGNVEGVEGPEMLDFAAKQAGYSTFDSFVEQHLRRGENAPVNSAAERKLEDDLRRIDEGEISLAAKRKSFWADEEDPDAIAEEHDEFDEDDITEMAHAKLDEVREMRHYQRLAVWELPLLSKLAKPFEAPTEKHVLRWRYTSYMGEYHPAEKKVVVQFAPDDLGLTPVQADKLKKLAGPRFNPEKEIIKISCESYPHPAQNKRYLSKLVDDLIAAAKDPKDSFADVPLDFRHHKFTSKPRFPKEWFLTEERKKVLEEGRRQNLLDDVHAESHGELVDGKQVIESYLLQKTAEEAQRKKVEQTVPAGRSLKSPARRSR